MHNTDYCVTTSYSTIKEMPMYVFKYVLHTNQN